MHGTTVKIYLNMLHVHTLITYATKRITHFLIFTYSHDT